MKGSYSVATGSSRSPLMACDSPSADIRMNRFISAMPSSMCCPFGRKIPVEGRGDLLAAEQVGLFGAREQPAAVDPGAEIGRHRDVGRRGDDARRPARYRRAPSSLSTSPKPCWVDICGDGLNESCSRHLDDRRGQAAPAIAVERRVRQKRFQRRRLLRQPLELLPFMPGPDVLRRRAISPSG